MSDHDDQSVFGGSPGSANESLIVTPRDCPSSARRRTSRRLPQRSPSYSPAPRPQEPRTSRAAAQRLRFPSPVRPGARGATASGIAPSGVGRRARRRRRSPAVDPARTSTASGSPQSAQRRKQRSRAADVQMSSTAARAGTCKPKPLKPRGSSYNCPATFMVSGNLAWAAHKQQVRPLMARSCWAGGEMSPPCTCGGEPLSTTTDHRRPWPIMRDKRRNNPDRPTRRPRRGRARSAGKSSKEEMKKTQKARPVGPPQTILWKLGQGTSQDWYCPECGNCVPRDRRRCFRCGSSHPPLPVERLEGRARSAGAR